ncbi:hypothetical protein RQP46_009689 [Phenoliferia psychrophenolica]
MFKASFARLATHAPRKPSIHFPDRHAPHPPHSPAPHPYAPKEVVEAFQSFLARQHAAASGAPLTGPAGGDGKGKGFASALPEADCEGDWDLPARFARARYSPEDAEIDAVLSGGATEAPVVTKAAKEKWIYFKASQLVSHPFYHIMSLIGKDEPIRIAIVGAGISGIAQAIRLKQDLGSKAIVTIYEREWRAGGVWRDSQWAGAGVDIPIHLYSLYSDLNPNWKSVYASQPEVLAYWESLIEKHGIRNQIQYNSKYIGSTWLEDEQAHAIIFESSGADKDRFEVIANVLISATGPLAKPVIPDIPGRELFKGASFHNLRWDSNVQLDGKRVAVLGNGSSGIQLVPGVAARPGVELIHFIRSGGYFLPKVNSDFSPLALWAFKWFPGAQRLYRNYLFFEAWVSPLQWPPLQRDSQKALQDRLLKYLEDKAPAEYLEALTPDYPVGCKRVAYDAGWLDSLHRKNVELVRDPVVRISETGLHTASGRSDPTSRVTASG